jgi:hypothetical protein
MQVRHKVEKIKGEAGPGPPAPAAASSLLLLALTSVTMTARLSLQMITLNPTVAPVVTVVGGVQCWYPPFSGDEGEGEENVAPRVNRQAELEEAQGRSCPGPRTCIKSRRQRGSDAEGSPQNDHAGDCTGLLGGVQGAGLCHDPKQKYDQLVCYSWHDIL